MMNLFKKISLCCLSLALMPVTPILAKPELDNNQIIDDGEAVQNKWVKIDEKWYKTDSEGYVLTNKWVAANATDWNYVGEDGAMVTDTWFASTGGRWYYVDNDGKMADSPLFINGKLYGFNSDGTWQRDDIRIKGVPVQMSGKYNEELVQSVLNQIKVLPESLTTLPKVYIFTDEFESSSFIRQTGETSSTSYYGNSGSWAEVEYIKFNSVFGDRTTALHELLHALDFKNLNAFSDDIEFNSCITQEKTELRKFLSSSAQELFAYAGEDVLTHYERAAASFPQTAAYLKKLFDEMGLVIPEAYTKVYTYDQFKDAN